MGGSGLATTLFGFISVATFLYVSLLCFHPCVTLSHQLSSGLTAGVAVGPLQARPDFKPSGYLALQMDKYRVPGRAGQRKATPVHTLPVPEIRYV